MSRRTRYLIAAAAAVVLVGAFAAFRPDTLFTDRTVDEELDPRVAAALDAAPTSTIDPPATAPASSAPSSAGASTVPAPTQPAPTTLPPPTVVSRGEWTSLDHETTGTVSVIRDGATSTLVLADLATSNGPDLFVYLSPVGVEAGGDYTAGAVKLGSLKGNRGTQTYEIPEGIDLAGFGSVVIWCDRFSSGFGVAGLAPA